MKKDKQLLKSNGRRVSFISASLAAIFPVAVIALGTGWLADAAESKKGKPLISATKARDRNYYAPNSETLKSDEMRVIACGTGMPTPRPAQAAACFLVELGNGDKFLFDIGDGSVERLFGLQIPTAYLDKVFIGHLHGDHFGGLGALYVAGGIAGRFSPLRIWGPSGSKPELGTKAAVEAMQKMFAWSIAWIAGKAVILTPFSL